VDTDNIAQLLENITGNIKKQFTLFGFAFKKNVEVTIKDQYRFTICFFISI